MRKLYFYLFIIFFSLTLSFSFSCKKNNNGEKDNEQTAFNYDAEATKLPAYFLGDTVLPTKIGEYDVEFKLDGNKIDNIVTDKNDKKVITLSVTINNETKDLNFTTYPVSIEELKDNIFNEIDKEVYEDINLPTNYLALYNIETTSSKPEIISNTGKYNKPSVDTNVDINFKFTIPDINVIASYSLSLTAMAESKQEKINRLVKELEELNPILKENLDPNMVDSTDLISSIPGHDDVEVLWSEADDSTDYVTNLRRNSKRMEKQKVTYIIKYKNNDDALYKNSYEFNVYPKTFAAVYNYFLGQMPKEIIEDIDYLDTTYLDCYAFNWTSSDTSLLTDEGIYHKPEVDTPINITLTISLIASSDYKIEKTFEVMVIGKTDVEKIDAVCNWLNNEVETELFIDSNISLPKVDPVYGIKLNWKTTNKDVIDLEGHVNRFVYDRYVELSCDFSSGLTNKHLFFWFKVKALDISTMTKQEIVDNFVKGIAVKDLNYITFNIPSNDEYTNITQSFNVLSFFNNTWEPVIKHIAPSGNSNRPGTIKKNEFICVHDTANNGETANGLAHAKYVEQGGGGTSFQYVVGNDGIYNLIPDNEVAYHAGDGTAYQYKLYDTGVKALTEKANLGISEDDYFTFNGQKSKIKIPADTIIKRITPSGIYYEIGENGNYWLNENYYNKTYEAISNRGGNNNSIGIETCVNYGSDYYLTFMLNANNVARLCTENNLSVDRVLQHNNFSGKPCPNAIRVAGMWQPFRDYVSQIKFGMAQFKDLTFEYHSNTQILSDKGFIKRVATYPDNVNYHITVKDNLNNVLVDKDFTTNLIK